MRDKRDTATPDLWGETPQYLSTLDVLAQLPRVRIRTYQIDGRTHQQFELVGHPHVPPIGGKELERVGRVVTVLEQRKRWHQLQARNNAFYRTPELIGHSSKEMHHAVMVLRYRDAIADFKRAEQLAEIRPVTARHMRGKTCTPEEVRESLRDDDSILGW